MAKRQGSVESVEVSRSFWADKRVFLTGHTGFKGGWLSLWLQSLGAEVHGYALSPPAEPGFFAVAGVRTGMASSTLADIRDGESLRNAMKAARPDVVFHLAAQPLVRYGYAHPVETFAVNVMGTVNVLDAVRETPGVKTVVNVTSDKCYENDGSTRGYRESDPMGGFDPYSSSKGCAELVTSAYRRSFLQAAGVGVASARAGNVIGGGDWAAERLVPDFLRAMDARETLEIRSPRSTRPWQHVLEPVSGYVALAERLHAEGAAFAEPWNFGPVKDDVRSVQWIVECLAGMRADAKWRIVDTPQPHEAVVLELDSGKARTRLGWRPRWRLKAALQKTLEWHDAWRKAADMRSATLAQIDEYRASAAAD